MSSVAVNTTDDAKHEDYVDWAKQYDYHYIRDGVGDEWDLGRKVKESLLEQKNTGAGPLMKTISEVTLSSIQDKKDAKMAMGDDASERKGLVSSGSEVQDNWSYLPRGTYMRV